MTFLLGPEGIEEELHAHKFFLITSSPVLHDILAHNAPANNNEIAELRIKDIPKETMLEVCRYAYSDTVQFTPDNMLNILDAALKLQMKFLVERAIDYISREGLNENNVFNVIEINKQLNNTKLTLKCFDYIKKFHPKCFKSPGFKQISAETFKLLIENCGLSQKTADEAITVWSRASPDNMIATDELIALTLINCKTEESFVSVSDDSDATSVADSVVSRTPSYGGEKRRDSNSRPRGGRDRNNGSRAAGKKNALEHKLMLLHNVVRMECAKDPNNRNFSLIGGMEMRYCKYSNLDFNTKCSMSIVAIHFNYDLRQTDRDFKLTIYDVTANKKEIYFMEIPTQQQKGEYTCHILPRPCRIDGPKNLWISIVFNASTLRPTFASNMMCEPNEFMSLRGPGSSTQSGQIISNIIFRLN